MTGGDRRGGGQRKPSMRQPSPVPDFVSPRKQRRSKKAAERPGGRGEADAVDGPVVDRPPHVLMDIDLKKEAVRLYKVGWSYPDIARKLDRPTRTVRGWIDETLREYVATPELVSELKRRQLFQISETMKTVFDVMKAGGTGKIALEAVDRLIKLQQQEAETAGFKGAEAEGDDPADAALQVIIEQARAEVAERERRLLEEL